VDETERIWQIQGLFSNFDLKTYTKLNAIRS
jgi:hypothetical protein